MQLELTERDKKLFQLVDDYGLLSTNQIRKMMFQNINQSIVLRRLRKLKNKKYLQPHTGLPKGELVWTLTLKSRALMNSSLDITVNKNQLEHDILVADIRHKLETAKVVSTWVSGFKLRQIGGNNAAPQSSKIQTPDGLFAIKTKDGIKIVALELELNSKTKRRYKEILKSHAENLKVNWVWYIVSQKSLGPHLCEQANKFVRPDDRKWLFTTHLKQLLSPNQSVILQNQDQSFTLIKTDQPPDHTQDKKI